MKLFKKKPKPKENPKCHYCEDVDAKGYVHGVPLCLECLVLTEKYTNQILTACKDEIEDLKEIANLEKRLFSRKR